MNEPRFTLNASDPASSAAMRALAGQLRHQGKMAEAMDADLLAAEMDAWRGANLPQKIVKEPIALTVPEAPRAVPLLTIVREGGKDDGKILHIVEQMREVAPNGTIRPVGRPVIRSAAPRAKRTR